MIILNIYNNKYLEKIQYYSFTELLKYLLLLILIDYKYLKAILYKL